MRYVTSIERLAIEEGMAKGIQQGMQQGMQQAREQMLASLLQYRFGALPEWAQALLEQASELELEQWAKALFSATSIEAVFGKDAH